MERTETDKQDFLERLTNMDRTVTSASLLDWLDLGKQARQAVEDCGTLDVQQIDDAYSFLLDNPECFLFTEWPADMPKGPRVEFLAGYFGLGDSL